MLIQAGRLHLGGWHNVVGSARATGKARHFFNHAELQEKTRRLAYIEPTDRQIEELSMSRISLESYEEMRAKHQKVIGSLNGRPATE